MNIITLNTLNTAVNPGQKSPILILSDKNSIRSTIKLEELSYFLKPSYSNVKGNSIFLQSNTNVVELQVYNKLNLTPTNIILTEYQEIKDTYEVLSENLIIDFGTSNNRYSYVFLSNEQITNIFFKNGTISNLNLKGINNLEYLKFGENTLSCNLLNLQHLFSLEIIDLTETNDIKFLLVFNKFTNKNYTFIDINHTKIFNTNLELILPILEEEIIYNKPVTFLFLSMNNNFTQEEITLATSKNISLKKINE